MGFRGIPWNFVEFRGISWNFVEIRVEFRGISWDFVVFVLGGGFVDKNCVEFRGIFFCKFGPFRSKRRFFSTKNVRGISRNSTGFCEIP